MVWFISVLRIIFIDHMLIMLTYLFFIRAAIPITCTDVSNYEIRIVKHAWDLSKFKFNSVVNIYSYSYLFLNPFTLYENVTRYVLISNNRNYVSLF